MQGVEDYCRELEKDFVHQAVIANSFRSSPVSKSIKKLLEGEKIDGVSKIQGISRDVYFCKLESGSPTVGNKFWVKVPKPATDFQNVLFDAYFLSNVRIRGDIAVPDYSFVVRSGVSRAIIVKDVSDSLQVMPLKDASLDWFNNSAEYSAAEDNYYSALRKSLFTASLNPQRMTDNCLSSEINSDLKTTGIVLHDNREFKKIACMDTDQLYPFLRDVLCRKFK